MEDVNQFDTDFDGYDDEVAEEPDFYYCIGCGHEQFHDGQCDRCCGYSMEPFYF